MKEKLFIFIALTAVAVLIAACEGGSSTAGNPVDEKGKMNHHDGHNMKAAGNSETEKATTKMFRAEFTSEPAAVNAGTAANLIFKVKDRAGHTIENLQIVHEKPMHLLVVSHDLAEFYHLHPERQPDGSYAVAHTFPNGGDYRLYADFTPPNSEQVVEPIELKVSGGAREKTALAPDQKFEKTVDGLRVVMKPSADIKAGQELMLDFQIFDALTGKPTTDLQNYLGELAHFVIISEDMKDFVHAHPMSKGEHDSMKNSGKNHHNADGHTHGDETKTKAGSQSEVAAHTAFPRSGKYKIWAQFQRNNQIITVPFVVNAG
jgi:hypothetical protein